MFGRFVLAASSAFYRLFTDFLPFRSAELDTGLAGGEPLVLQSLDVYRPLVLNVELELAAPVDEGGF